MSFDGSRFIQHIAKRLVSEFEFSAESGTPGLVGAAKEHPARAQLARLLPEGVAVGSGIVVDSYGGVSKQQDIVIYEKLCPVFTHNDTAEATYFPIEGVIAVGEIKSTLSKKELEDAFEKCKSVKKLRRHAVLADDRLNIGATVSFRNYTNTICFSGTKDEEFNQEKNSLHQVFAFVLCEAFGASPETMLSNAAYLFRGTELTIGPNFLASLKDGFIVPHNSAKQSITRSPIEADGIIFCNQQDDAFAQLLSLVRIYVRSGKTVDAKHFERYFHPPDGEKPALRIAARVAFKP